MTGKHASGPSVASAVVGSKCSYRVPRVLVLAILGLIAISACSHKTRLQILAVAVQAALEELSEQKAATADAFGEAREARKVAFSQPEFTFSSKKTQKFIDRWREAADEVRELRSDFNEAIEKADFLFAYAEKKQAAIRNSDLSTRAASGIEQRKSSFATAAKATDQVIRSLERTLEEGDDLISALEIAGVLGTLSSEVRELQGMHDRAVASLPELEALVREGEKLVDDEFSALGV